MPALRAGGRLQLQHAPEQQGCFECHQERDRKAVGTEVSGVPSEPREANRSGSGESGEIPDQGAGEVAELTEPNQHQLRDAWRQYLSGWWGYYRLAENRRPILRLEGWIRGHILACFWQRWHGPEGTERQLRQLGLRGQMVKIAGSSGGAWHLARTGSLQTALLNATLRRYGFLMPSDLAGIYYRGFQPPDAENRTSGGVGG